MAKSKGGGKKAAASSEPMYVASKVKAALKAAGCNVAGDALEGLQGWIGWHIQQAAARAKANGRKTVRAHDFILPM
jgi:histone H3/H4